jgi:hypothetical protein
MALWKSKFLLYEGLKKRKHKLTYIFVSTEINLYFLNFVGVFMKLAGMLTKPRAFSPSWINKERFHKKHLFNDCVYI